MARDDAPRPLVPFDDALAAVLDGAAGCPVEGVQLREALGRVLAEDARSPEDLPAAPLSSRDGYALPATDGPARLRVSREVRAGDPPGPPLGPGEAARIFTGAPLPPGASTILMQEHATREGDLLVLKDPVPAGRFVRPIGCDCRAGEQLLPAGTRLRPEHVGLLASVGLTAPPVHRRPVVAFLVNGDEVVDPSARPVPPGKVRNSNHPALHAMIEAAGATPLYLGCVGDCRATLAATLTAAPPCDVLLTVGGASVGDHDHMLGVARELGFDVRFSRVAIRPGKPVIFGRRDGRRFLGLPGNPVSCLVVFHLLVRPLLLKLGGARRLRRQTTAATLATTERKEAGLRYFLPGRLRLGCLDEEEPEAVKLLASPAERRESSSLLALADASCLIVLPEHLEVLGAGSEVTVLRLDGDEVA